MLGVWLRLERGSTGRLGREETVDVQERIVACDIRRGWLTRGVGCGIIGVPFVNWEPYAAVFGDTNLFP